MEQKLWHEMSTEEVLVQQKSDIRQGLSQLEAKKRLERWGSNELREKIKISPLALFLNQFKDFMVLVLVGAVLISGLLGEFLDAITIIAIIVMNGILGFVQEYRAERSLRALQKMSAPVSQVLRDSRQLQIPSRELVPGDIVFLQSGDRIPADIRFLSVQGLQVEESALTGESVSVLKTEQLIAEQEVSLGDQRNLGFMGTMVTKGAATAVVVRTGMNTEMGKIADLIQNTEAMQTPLQHRLEQLGKTLISVAIGLTLLVVAAGILHGQPAYGMFLAGVSLAVAAIPEGLPAIVTIALALGVQRMIRKKAVVRKLPSVETLGCASVICSDKTGTLTQNKMTVTQLWCEGRNWTVSGNGYEPKGDIFNKQQLLDLRKNPAVRRMLQVALLCNNAELMPGNKQQKREAVDWKIKGDPTEGALVVLATKAGMNAEAMADLYRRVKELPFDSERKRMSVVVEHQGGRLVCTKGAADVLVQKCRYALWQGQVRPLDDRLRQKIAAANDQMAHSALRVLGMAFREIDEQVQQEEDIEKDLIFIGLCGMIDPPRHEVADAILKCRHAGIKAVMITGDHQATAEAIANQLGMQPGKGKTIIGSQLTAMTDQQLDQKIDDIDVFARVTPEHKLRIVKSLQRNGHIVAMTGDGVNDAPAVKAADIGISMGMTGTDVTKEASALVLSDDNFATIVAAIEEGRGIYENIRKFIRYMLASNVGEILTMFIAVMLGMPLPLVPIQILWVNLVTDGLPAMALGVDSAEDDLMNQRPRPAKENIFARSMGWKIISRGILIGLCTLAAFWLTLQQSNLQTAQTVAFATLVMAQLIHVFDCRSSKSVFHRNIFENKYLVGAVLSSIGLLLAVIYLENLQPIFKTTPLALRDWCLILFFAGIPTILVGVASVIKHGMRKKKTIFSRRPI